LSKTVLVAEIADMGENTTQHFDLKSYLAERKKLVDEALEECFPAPAGLEKKVIEAVRYSLLAGGKRLRPILCLAAAEVVGTTPRVVLPAACALEMIHTYSLIHDDLPAMDNDDYRRGKLTNHKIFGDAIAILAGDALLTEAFGIMASAHTRKSAPGSAVESDRMVKAIAVLAKAAGYRGMVGGQVIDLEFESTDVDIAAVEYMHVKKTGALISASLEMGGLLGGGSEEQLKALIRYGHHLGLAFQITDDLLDVEGEADVMGKEPGSDAAKNKKTYPALLGVPQTKQAAREHVDEALKALESFQESAEPLRSIARYLLTRKA
jgi:geranylgeranyl diphosphate synthase type II